MLVLQARYAEALLACAQSPQEADRIQEALQQFCAVLDQQDAAAFLLNPVIRLDAKQQAIGRLLPPDTPITAANFLHLLLAKGRLVFLHGIVAEYKKQRQAVQGMLCITVCSAQPLAPGQLEELRLLYMRQYGARQAQVETRVDPSLLGGICVQIGDIRVDDTLRTRLRGLYAQVVQQQVGRPTAEDREEWSAK